MIRIVTDSTADIPDILVHELNICVVPIYVIFGTQSYRDGIDITREEFYTRLQIANPLPTTSTPNAGDFQNAYRSLIDKGAQHIISIHIAAKLSAILNAARSAAEEMHDAQITFIDSEQVSMGLGWQVIEAARMAQAGQSVEAIVAALKRLREQVRVYAALDTLEYVRRSGRVSWASATIGQLLKIKPMIELRGGEALSLDRVRTRAHSIQRLKQLVREQAPLRDLAVMHTYAADSAQQLADEFREEYPALQDPIYVLEVTTALGTHVGPNGLGVACVRVSS